MELFEKMAIFRQIVGHYQNAGGDSALAKNHALLYARYGKPLNAFGFQDFRNLDAPVPVRVGFYYGHHLHGGRDRGADGSKIVADGRSGDLDPATHGPAS
jgi:hypothetical protein